MRRRDFLSVSLSAVAGVGALSAGGCTSLRADSTTPGRSNPLPIFRISIAEWSLNRALNAGEMTNLDFPIVARQRYDINAVEYVNTFFKDKATDAAYLSDLKSRCDGEGVASLLIMCDQEGRLGDPDDSARTRTVENHYRWIDAAKTLGCHSIRVNAASTGDWDTQRDLAADGLRRLTMFGAEREINVIVENHGGISSNGAWLAEVMRKVDHDRCGTLPDFGNFEVSPGEWYDRYQGVRELMPFAKAVSAKSHEFDENGNEMRTDYARMMSIVLDAGYRGYVGIEWEGEGMSDEDGIRATKNLLLQVRKQLSDSYK